MEISNAWYGESASSGTSQSMRSVSALYDTLQVSRGGAESVFAAVESSDNHRKE